MKRILGIDYGDKRIGLSISDPMGWTAQGIATLQNHSKEQVFESLKTTCREREVVEVVIGLPINMNGTIGPRAQQVLDLVPQLEEALGIPVKTWDERLTSREAGRLMIEEGLSRQKQKSKSDELAATILLQGYLDSKR